MSYTIKLTLSGQTSSPSHRSARLRMLFIFLAGARPAIFLRIRSLYWARFSKSVYRFPKVPVPLSVSHLPEALPFRM
jgi:hypothetical protein